MVTDSAGPTPERQQGNRRRRRANSDKAKAMRRLTDGADARACTYCSRRFDSRAALDRHLAASHASVMTLKPIKAIDGDGTS
jgi:hypothetical protein